MKKKPFKKNGKNALKMSEKSCAKMLFTADWQKGKEEGEEREQRVESARGAALKHRRKVCNTLGFAVAS